MHMLILTLKLEHFRCSTQLLISRSYAGEDVAEKKSIHLSTLNYQMTTKSLTMDAVWGIIDDGVVLIENSTSPQRTFRIQLVNSCN